jgi:hypothetical protein
VIECSICKAHNEDRSLFCLECGQRLIPRVPDANTTANILPSTNSGLQPINHSVSGRLHSPMLDMDDEQEERRNQSRFNSGQDFSREANAGRPHSISRNGLHSPLLDQNQFTNPHPYSNKHREEEESMNIPAAPPLHSIDKSRLHSPVLDGPGPGSFGGTYIEETYSGEEDYESLRSPLLSSKVPLPIKNEPLENVALGQESRLQSLLSPAIGPATKIPVHSNIANQESAVAPLSVTGINQINKANNARASRSKLEKMSGSHSLLPNNDDMAPNLHSDKGKSALNKMFFSILIFSALIFKIWYLVSLGSAAFGSAAFAFDQAGQIIVLLSILVLLLS